MTQSFQAVGLEDAGEWSKTKSPDPENLLDADDELEQNFPLSEGAVNIPDGPVVGIESGNGLGLGLEVESDGDHEDDEDFIMELSDGDEGSYLGSDGECSVHEIQEPQKKADKVTAAKVSSLFPPSVRL